MGMQSAQREWECDSCLWSVSGYSKGDLEKDGWQFHRINVTRNFVLCDECVQRYEKAWALKAQATAA